MRFMAMTAAVLVAAGAYAGIPARGVPAGCDGAAMSEVYWAVWNAAEQARMDADIERYRKADGEFAVDAPEGTEVTVEQIDHEFRFGAHIFNFNQLGKTEWNDAYKASYGKGGIFNQATVAYYWKNYEPVPGKLRAGGGYEDSFRPPPIGADESGMRRACRLTCCCRPSRRLMSSRSSARRT